MIREICPSANGEVRRQRGVASNVDPTTDEARLAELRGWEKLGHD